MNNTHKHHIIPRHIGGTDHPDNIVRLTHEGHAIAHLWLFIMHGRWQDKLAWRCLSGKMTSAEAHSEATKAGMVAYYDAMSSTERAEHFASMGNPGEKNHMYGKKHSAESKKLMSKNRSGMTTGVNNHRSKGRHIGTNIETGEVDYRLYGWELKEANFTQSAVSSCVNGQLKQHKGYTWTREVVQSAA